MLDDKSAKSHSFQVDLRGLVDLLSHHLYSSPRVYVRELLQNAVDAVTARRRIEPAAPTAIRIAVDRSGLRIDDPGIGLTEADVHRFLATIGRSSKRDDLEGARREFLGQFGIGLLACFTVAERIQVLTRPATNPEDPGVEWLAASDGTYSVRRLEPGERAEPGTTVRLTPRPGAERWFAPELVAGLARDFGALLPYEVTVEADGRTTTTTDGVPVWGRTHSSPAARRSALIEYGEQVLGFTALDVIELDVELAGVRGAAYVLPRAANPADSGRHRVYLKGMLLSDVTTGLLPDWAFFVRCVIDTDTLRPTASREGLYEDETLAAVREALGVRVRDWLTGLAAQDPGRLAAFLSVHSLGVKALARHDRDLFRIMLPYLAFETTDGRVTLEEFARKHPVVRVTSTVEEFRQIATIASAQGVGVVNGGYTYETELVALLPEVMPGVAVEELGADVVTAALDPVDGADELAMAGFLATARATLDPLGCDVILRAFFPASVSALHLDTREARNERTRAETAADADDLWAEILGALKSAEPRAQLVLNHRSPVVRRLAAIRDQTLLVSAIEALYGQALLMTHRPLRPVDTALLNRAFDELLGWASHNLTEPPQEDDQA
ncbi:HSP90 family protein [Planotetraspora phitsanulokensis]|uniref:Molecular chaperone HtpG n=1 Tax=Planotetraspora phitsanulokensis TaxID=575192 RepID=A0A8J3TYT9_9ACTN|nr:HSP90 family protein [Planotetraspora phitsanulokensis]GII35081.1 molecular chaperone HtpG [Planotetraspora phitsanulokensis]